MYTATALAGAAILSKAAEVAGIDHDMPTLARMAVDSGAHPIIGYMGAWAANTAANAVSRNPFGAVKAKFALAAVTAANFAVEGAQSLLVASPQYIDFMSQRNFPETAKDYAFALAGMGLYMFQQKRR